MFPCSPPPPLQPGDRLQVIFPSGALRETEALQRGIEVWRSHGFRVEWDGEVRRWGYLAGTDEERRSQLQRAWQDPECRGILCGRGGYGGARLLEEWQWTVAAIRQQPKWVIGFSDITSLLWSLGTQGISGVHGPVLTTLAQEPEESIQRLMDWLQGKAIAPLKGKGWGGGATGGLLLPGNLTVATHLLHTPLQPNFSHVILALEDVTEAPYRIDRMLTQWRMSGVFEQVKGIALGRFSQCDSPAGVPSLSVEEVLRDRLSSLRIPIVSDLPFGHGGENAALPVGVPVHLDADMGTLSFTV